jgi:CRP-like cAMP-binding protein
VAIRRSPAGLNGDTLSLRGAERRSGRLAAKEARMVHPDLLRRYPFFGFLTVTQRQEVAMITEEVAFEQGKTIFEYGDPADAMYLLVEGAIDLHYTVVDDYEPELRRDFLIGEIAPGEAFAFSALVEPYTLTATAVTTSPCKALRIEAEALRALCEEDSSLACNLMVQIAQVMKARLHAARIQLAAARA